MQQKQLSPHHIQTFDYLHVWLDQDWDLIAAGGEFKFQCHHHQPATLRISIKALHHYTDKEVLQYNMAVQLDVYF